jgi:hypothetical protein
MEAVEERADVAISIELSPAELELVRAGLTMLLHTEDDPAIILELKALLSKLARQLER